MKLELYYKFLKNPRLLNENSLVSLEELVSSYPYAENFRILYALNLLVLDDYKYQENLHKAALYSSDRKKLKYWVDFMIQQEEDIQKLNVSEDVEILDIASEREEDITQENSPSEESHSLETVNPANPKIEISPAQKKHSPSATKAREKIQEPVEGIDKNEIKKQVKAIRTKAELLQLVRKRLAEIESEKKEKEKSDEVLKPQIHDINTNLIDRFIESQPSISRPDKSSFFDPQKEAVDSSIDEDDFFVTETLAQIHMQQGNIKKAIEIYRKLILKIPEKSTYFAAQIQELSNK